MFSTMMNKIVVLLIASLALLIFSTSAFAALEFFDGNVTIGSNTSTDGAIINGYINGVKDSTTMTVGQEGVRSNSYIMDLQCTQGDALSIRVWGIEAATVTCDATEPGVNSTNLSVSLVTSGGACTYSSACSTANNVCCSGTTEINDGSTTGATCKSTCAAAATTTTTTTGGAGSGGGGGGTSATETSSAVTISGPTSTSIPFNKASTIAVSNIELTTTTSAAIVNGKITVRKTTVANTVSSAIVKGSTKVYKYLSITKVNIKNSDIDKATITFEVPFTWLNSNNIDKNSVKLNRLVNSDWVTLPTTRVSDSSSASIYEAETPGFSTFAISGEEIGEKLTAFQLIDIIRDFYAGTTSYTAFDIIDLIRNFYS